MQTQPPTWSSGSVQNLVGDSTQIGSPRPCHTEARDASVGNLGGRLGKLPLFFQHVLAIFGSFPNRIFFLQSAFPKLQRASHCWGTQGYPHFLLEQHSPHAQSCACLQSAMGSLAIVPTPSQHPLSCQGLCTPLLQPLQQLSQLAEL